MKKVLLTLALLTVGIYYSQTAPKFENNELITSTGYKVHTGSDLKIGTGTMDNGNFKFIRLNGSKSEMDLTTSVISNRPTLWTNSFDRSNSGLTFKVKKIMTRGSKKHGYVYYAKIGKGLANYEVDLENAIKSGEIIVPEEFMSQMKSELKNDKS
jgi:hypothetical protein